MMLALRATLVPRIIRLARRTRAGGAGAVGGGRTGLPVGTYPAYRAQRRRVREEP